MRLPLLSVPALALAGLLLAGCSSDDAGDGLAMVDDAGVPDGWTTIDDDGSGISVAMPEEVDPQEQDSATADGGTMTARSYFVVHDGVEVGFNVLDLAGGTYDLEAGLDGTVGVIDGEIQSRETITVDGYEGLQAEVTFDDQYVTVFQLVLLDDHVFQPMASTEQENLDAAVEYLDQLVGSAELG